MFTSREMKGFYALEIHGTNMPADVVEITAERHAERLHLLGEMTRRMMTISDVDKLLFLLGEKYIASLERMGSTDNAKIVVLPADLQEAVRGLIGGATRR